MLTKDIKYGTPLHDSIKTAIKDRRDYSKKKMQDLHNQWNRAEDSMKAYIKPREIDLLRKAGKDYEGQVDFVSLEIPYIYAIIMTAHTYFTSVMLARNPVYQFTARHGETQDSVDAVEAVMDYQLRVGNHLPTLYNWIYDLARYSVGIVGTYWDVEEKIISKIVKQPREVLGVQLPWTEKTTMIEEKLLGYMGNKLFCVRPYDFYPDPRVPLWRFQEGEFCIRDTSEGYHSIIGTEHTFPGYYCNLDKLVSVARERAPMGEQGSSQLVLPFKPGEGGRAPGPGFFKVSDAYVKIVPKVWGLSESNRTELWCFQLAEDEVVISAKPAGAYHNMFPYAVMEGNFGSEEFAKIGLVEIIKPMTDVLTWLLNSHFYNVRRVLNNQMIIDPSRIVVKDLTKSGQRIVRLKPAAYGTKPYDAVHQLNMLDVTRQHLGDTQFIEQMIQRASGVADNVMGMAQQGGRRSATEARQQVGWSTNRLRTPVEYNSALGLSPLTQIMLSNTQQYMSQEIKVMLTGNLAPNAQRFITATPDLIAGSYDFVPVDGVQPIDRLGQANFWKELLMQMMRSPEMLQQWDVAGMIGHMMKLQGERNIDRFRIKANVMPPGVDPSVEAGRGNLVALQGGRSGGPNRPRAAAGSSGGTI